MSAKNRPLMASAVTNKRVLCLTSNFPRWPGDTTTPFVLHLCQDLARLGWGIDVLAPHAPGAAFRETLGGLETQRFQYAWPVAAQTVCYQGGALVNLRKRPLDRLKLPVLVAAEWAAVQRRLATGAYALLHSHWVLPQGFVGMLATTLQRVPHVITVHGGDLFALRSPFLESLKRSALKRASVVTVNSSFTEQRTRTLAPGLRNVERIPMGVDEAPLAPAEQARAATLRSEHRRNQGPLLVFAGRLVEEKGAEDAILALSLLVGDLPDAHLLVIGEGQDRLSLQALTQTLGLAGNVTFLGWVEPHEMRAHLACADVFLGPSRTASNGWVEAQGLTFLEAMAAGTAVVATRSGGIVDSVVHERTGLLVDERAPEQLASAVRRLVGDEQLRRTLIAAGHDLLTTRFSRRESSLRFSAVYEACLGG